jgi:DNA-binding NtrC family response regulator
LEKAVLLDDLEGDTPPPTPRDEGEVDLSIPFRAAKEVALEGWERRYLASLIRQARGNISEAARLSRLDRGHLRELLRQHGIVPEPRRS